MAQELKFSLKKGEIISVNGEAVVRIVKGSAQFVGADMPQGTVVKVPLGKRIPVEAISAAEITVKAKPEQVEPVAERTIPKAWDEMIARVKKEKLKTIMVLGEMDTGKSFFCTYAANRLLSQKVKVAVLNCDVGQSDIGPPGCFGLLVLTKPAPFLFQADPTALYMVGAHSPGLHFLPTICALNHMKEKARASADVLIVNTNGWVQGDGGRAFKKMKIELLDPDVVVLMQRGNELEHLVRRVEKKKIIRNTVSRKATFTPPDERKKLREEVSLKYMAGAKTILVKGFETEGVYYGTGAPEKFPEAVPGLLHAERLSAWEGWLLVTKEPIAELGALMGKVKGRIHNVVAGVEKNLMVGLLDAKGDCLGIGSLQSLDWAKGTATISTPVKKAAAVKALMFGSLRITADGHEDGFLAPGAF